MCAFVVRRVTFLAVLRDAGFVAVRVVVLGCGSVVFLGTELASRTAALAQPTPMKYVTRKSAILFIPLYIDNMLSNFAKKY